MGKVIAAQSATPACITVTVDADGLKLSVEGMDNLRALGALGYAAHLIRCQMDGQASGRQQSGILLAQAVPGR